MKKFMVGIAIVMAMVMSVMAMGPQKAFASTFNEERVAYTQTERIDEEMRLFEDWFADYCEGFGVTLVEQHHNDYGDFVVWSYVATDGVENEAESTILSIEEVHDIAIRVKAWHETERLSDWM